MNRDLLSSDDGAAIRRRKLEMLFSTMERLGYVITIREMLMMLAYLISGGLRCDDVHAKLGRRERGWQHEYAFYNSAFGAPGDLGGDQVRRIPILLELARVDPGRIASRRLDEILVNGASRLAAGGIDLMFSTPLNGGTTIDASNGIDDIIGNPSNRSERRRESEFTTHVVRCLRRRAFFDEDDSDSQSLSSLGFQSGREFLQIVEGDLAPAILASLKSRIIAGLHIMQGLQLASRQASLHVVDPAFGNATSRAAIISCRIPPNRIKLISAADTWPAGRDRDQQAWAVTEAVDWLDRHVALRIEGRSEKQHDLPLDLMLFDCVVRAGAGYVAEEFYAHDIRRIMAFLARVSEDLASADSGISLFLGGRVHEVSIDDGVIQVGGG